MKSNHDFSPPIPMTSMGDLPADETVRAVMQRRGNLVHLRVEYAAGHTMQFSLSLFRLLAKLTRHGSEVISSQASVVLILVNILLAAEGHLGVLALAVPPAFGIWTSIYGLRRLAREKNCSV